MRAMQCSPFVLDCAANLATGCAVRSRRHRVPGLTRVLQVVVAVLGMLAPSLAQDRDGANPIDFARDVRPILSDRCFVCHGPDAAKREAGLRLDLRDAALQQLPSGRFAIVPGQPDQSELLRRLTAHDVDERMPPAASKLSVTAAEVAVLRRWVAAGAAYTMHW